MNMIRRVSIPHPCTEDWNQMQPRNCGRFCNSCQKTVVDFTTYSDADFIAYFQKEAYNPCGRFTQHQLSLPLGQTSKPIPAWLRNSSKYITAAFIGLTGLTTQTDAQENRTEQNSSSNGAIQTTYDTYTSVKIRGNVLDYNGDGVPGASIQLLNAQSNAITDIDGRFEISIDGLQKWPLHMHIISIGQDTTLQVNISEVHPDKPLLLRLPPNDSLIMGAVVIGKRKNGLWYRITKPFRKSRH